MSKTNSILQRKKYGQINFRLKELLDSRGMARNYLARKTGSRFEAMDKWYKNRIERVDIDILARICFVPECEVEDVIEYTKQDNIKSGLTICYQIRTACARLNRLRNGQTDT